MPAIASLLSLPHAGRRRVLFGWDYLAAGAFGLGET